MDLNLRKAGKQLLKASQNIKAGSDATIVGLKVGADAAIAAYNKANKSGIKTTGVVHSRNIECESEGKWHNEIGKSVSFDTAVGRHRQPLQLQLEPAGERNREAGIWQQSQTEGERRCTSAPCQGLNEFLKFP